MKKFFAIILAALLLCTGWADLPMPIYTFLEEYDFGEKTIIPFVTHGGSGFSNTRKTYFRSSAGSICER